MCVCRLESLGDSDVLKKELGITSFGHRMQIVKHIQGLLSKDQQEGGSGSSLSDREDSTGRERSSSSGSREGSGSFSPRPSLPGTEGLVLRVFCGVWRARVVCRLS